MADTERSRLQFDFSSEALARLDAMQHVLHAKNRAQVVRQALKVLEWLLSSEEADMIEVHREGELIQRLPAKTLLS